MADSAQEQAQTAPSQPYVMGPRGRAMSARVLPVALAIGVATTSILGPMGLGVLRYRTSVTTLNQLLAATPLHCSWLRH